MLADRYDAARAILNGIINDNPGSTMERQAKKRLRQIEMLKDYPPPSPPPGEKTGQDPSQP